jgi:cholesterol transport system auxiliary component
MARMIRIPARGAVAGAALAAALMTSGCISLLPEPPDPPSIFALRADDDLQKAPASPRVLSVAVMDVQAPTALAGRELPVVMADGSLAYVRGAVWTEDAPDAVRNLIIETFDRTGLARAAASSTGARADMMLSVDLVSFGLTPSRRRAPARADIVLVARMLDGRNRSVLAVERFAVTGPAGDDGPAGAAAALGDVARRAALDVARWTAGQTVRPGSGPTGPAASGG